MLDGILGRGFAPKCKSLIKQTKNRIDVLRRKRNATIKFLKKDLADLLANGLDINAYGRAGGLLDELRHLWNLEFVEKSCDFVYKHLSVMQKIGDCPEACREAVSSLMFAAAGFSELPELRELRHTFHERYGDSLELFVNQEFVENLSSKPFSLEKKVKLMEDIASEFSMRWDSKAFEQRLTRHNASLKDQHKIHGSVQASKDKYKPTNGNEAVERGYMRDFSYKDGLENGNDGHRLFGKKENEAERSNPMSQPAQKLFSERHMQDQHKNRGPLYDAEDEHRSINGNEAVIRGDRNDLSHKNRGPLYDAEDKHRSINGNEAVIRGDRNDLSSNGRSEKANYRWRSLAKDNESERNNHIQSRQKLSRERHKPLYDDAETPVLKVKHESFLEREERSSRAEHEPWIKEDLSSRTPRSSRAEHEPWIKEDLSSRTPRSNRAEHEPWKKEDLSSRTPRSSSSSKRGEKFDAASKLRNGRENGENAFSVRESPDGLLHGKPDITPAAATQPKSKDKDPFGCYNWGSEYNNANSTRRVQEEEVTKPKPYFNNALPPPYIKPNGKPKDSKLAASGYPHTGFGGNAVPEEHFSHNRAYAGTRSERAQVGESSHPDNDMDVNAPERANGHENVKDLNHQDDGSKTALLKRRLSRRRHSKSVIHDDTVNPDDTGAAKRRSRSRRDRSRRGLQVLFDDEQDQDDEEEKIIDKLLMHYSKKPSCHEPPVKVKSKSKSRHAHNLVGTNEGDGSDDMLEVPTPARSISLPHEQTAPPEMTKVFARAASFQPDRSSVARHVHPKLPDYDDLAARFAALKGSS